MKKYTLHKIKKLDVHSNEFTEVSQQMKYNLYGDYLRLDARSEIMMDYLRTRNYDMTDIPKAIDKANEALPFSGKKEHEHIKLMTPENKEIYNKLVKYVNDERIEYIVAYELIHEETKANYADEVENVFASVERGLKAY